MWSIIFSLIYSIWILTGSRCWMWITSPMTPASISSWKKINYICLIKKKYFNVVIKTTKMALSLLINILLKSITGKRVKTNIFKPQTVRKLSHIFIYRRQDTRFSPLSCGWRDHSGGRDPLIASHHSECKLPQSPRSLQELSKVVKTH